MRSVVIGKRKSFTATEKAAPPVITLSSSTGIAVVGTEFVLPITGEVFSDEPVYIWGLDLAPEGAEIDGTGANINLTWTPSAEQVRNEPYAFDVTLECCNGQRDVATVTIDVVAAVAPDALLTAEWIPVPTGAYNLTTGAVDWMAFARTDAADVDRKDGGDVIVGVTLLNDTTTVVRNTRSDREPRLQWSDGDTVSGVASFSGHQAALSRWSVLTADNRNFRLDINAATTKREAYIFCTIRSGTGTANTGTVEVSMADEPVEMIPLTMSVAGASTSVNYAMKVGFKASEADKTLSVLFKPESAGETYSALMLAGVKVIAIDDEPALSATPDDFDVDQGTSMSTAIALANAPTGAVTLSCAGVPATGEFKDNGNGTGTFTYSAPADAIGTIGLVFTATVGGNVVATLSRTITHSESVVAPPALTYTASQSLTVGTEKVVAISATTADTGSLLTFETTGALPGSATFASLQAVNSAAAEFRWTPASGSASATPYAVAFKCTDASGRVSEGALSLTVS